MTRQCLLRRIDTIARLKKLTTLRDYRVVFLIKKDTQNSECLSLFS